MSRFALQSIALTDRGNLEAPCTIVSESSYEWVMLADRSCHINPKLTPILMRAVATRPDIAIFFGDEVVVSGEDCQHFETVLKPEFDLTQLLAIDYIGWPLLVRARVFEAVAARCDARSEAFTFEFLLRAVSAGHGIGRIPDILSSRRERVQRATAHARQAIAAAWMAEVDAESEIAPGRATGISHMSRRFVDYPPVSIVVPARVQEGHFSASKMPIAPGFIEGLNGDFWPADRLTILVESYRGDHGGYPDPGWPFAVERVALDGGNGRVQRLNELWHRSKTDHVIFVDSDAAAHDQDWLRALMSFAMIDDVGAVGARLLDRSGAVKPIGIESEDQRRALVSRNAAMVAGAGLSLPDVQHECSIVSGTVLATRRSVLERIGGFDERFETNLYDLDACLRLRMLGYRIIHTPDAELILNADDAAMEHRSGSDISLFLQRWRDFLNEDPAGHPRLTNQAAMATSGHHLLPDWARSSP